MTPHVAAFMGRIPHPDAMLAFALNDTLIPFERAFRSRLFCRVGTG